MMDYKFREPKGIDDPKIIRYCVTVQKMRNLLSSQIVHAISQFTDTPLTTSNRVALAILQRINETSQSIELLCAMSRVRDASVLLLNAIELRLDLQYIALDIVRAEMWIDHAIEGRKPWSVKSQLAVIFSNENERNAEIAVYRQYSMAKHGNPVGKSFSFPIAVTRDEMILDDSKSNNPLIPIHLFSLAMNIWRAGEAASKIWLHNGMNIGQFVEDLRSEFAIIKKYNEQYILEAIQGMKTSVTQED